MNPVPNPLTEDPATVPWWIWLPGMQSDSRMWPDANVANQICATACTAYLLKRAGITIRMVERKRIRLAQMQGWLDEADSKLDAYMRRLVLCLAVDTAGPDDEAQRVLDWAKSNLYHRN